MRLISKLFLIDNNSTLTCSQNMPRRWIQLVCLYLRWIDETMYFTLNEQNVRAYCCFWLSLEFDAVQGNNFTLVCSQNMQRCSIGVPFSSSNALNDGVVPGWTACTLVWLSYWVWRYWCCEFDGTITLSVHPCACVFRKYLLQYNAWQWSLCDWYLLNIWN